MNAKTIDEMHEELRKAGYDVGVSLVPPFARGIVTPDGFAWQEKGIMGDKKELYAEIVQKAWQHFQQQKQHEAMRALLEEIFADGDSVCRAIHEQQPMATGADFTFDLPMTFNRMVKIKQLLESMKG